jgi:hypothetical protein
MIYTPSIVPISAKNKRRLRPRYQSEAGKSAAILTRSSGAWKLTQPIKTMTPRAFPAI